MGTQARHTVARMGTKSSVTLNKSVAAAAQPGEENYIIWDAELAGFGLRVMKSAVKSFVVRYYADGGGRNAPRRLMTIGRLGTLTVEQARKKARAVLGAAANGDDPGAKRTAKRKEMLISELVDHYEKEGCVIQRGKRIGEPMAPLTKQYTMARIRHHILPLLGTKRVNDVGAADVERFVRDVTQGKTARDEKVGKRKRIIVRGGEGAARKAVRDLSAMYGFAKRHEIAERNPVMNAAVRKTDNARDRFLSIEEVRKLGEAFDTVERDGANPKAVAIARLWALTGCRRNEIAALTWAEVDLDRGYLMLVATKTGRSVRPLGMAAVQIFRGIEREENSDFVFPATSGESFFQGTKRIWEKVKKLSGLHDVSPHTLRHTMGSTSTSAGQALALTGAILGHKNPRSTAIYAHVDLQPAQRAAERASGRIARAMGRPPSKPRKRAKPVPASPVSR